jgi:hypothetical protein
MGQVEDELGVEIVRLTRRLELKAQLECEQAMELGQQSALVADSPIAFIFFTVNSSLPLAGQSY